MNGKKDLLKNIKYHGMKIGCICTTNITLVVIGMMLLGERVEEIGLNKILESLQSQESISREVGILFTFMLTYFAVILIFTITIIKACKKRVEILEKELSRRGIFYEIINKDYVRGISFSNDKDIYNIGKKYTVITDANKVYILKNKEINKISLEKRKSGLGLTKHYLVIVTNKEIVEISTEKNRINEILTVYRKMGIGF